MTKNTCTIDGNGGDHFAVQFGWQYLRCQQCGLQWVANTPTAKQLGELYSPISGYQRHHSRQKVDRANPHYRTLVRLAVQSQSTSLRILDVGCSAGDVAVPLLERGYTVDGIEPNETTARVASTRGVRVIGADINDLRNDAQYDIIIASEVIEHVPEPDVFLARIRKALSPGGTLILSTPNTSSWFARMTARLSPHLGVPVSYLTAPYHLTYFDPQTLRALLAKHGLQARQFYFRHGPGLRYELGNLHLWGAFKRSRSVSALVQMLVGFSATTALWCISHVAVTAGIPGFQMYAVASTRAGISSGPEAHATGKSSIITRFLIGGIAITALQAGLLYLLSTVLGIWYLAAAQLSFAIAFIVSFLIYREWVFPTSRSGVGPQFLAYALLTGLNFIGNGILMYLLVTWVQFGPVSSQVAVKALIAVMNFVAYRSVVFRI